ncbi:MAG: alpha/beta hydrolase [Ilumatobacteraceae bacterium]
MRLLFLHALPFGGEMWADEMAHFGNDALAPTLYDTGDSLTHWATAALHLVGDEPVVVIGCSVGGSCALEVARLAPEQVAGIVLIGAKADVRPEPALRDAAIAHIESTGVDSAWAEYWRPLFGPNTPAATVEAAHLLAHMVTPASLQRGVRAFHDRNELTAFAAAWTRPLIGISGAHDISPAPATVRSLATGPNRRFHLVADCGHYVSLEQPSTFRSLLAESIEWIMEAGQGS